MPLWEIPTSNDQGGYRNLSTMLGFSGLKNLDQSMVG
jgi:hypothetical protein